MTSHDLTTDDGLRAAIQSLGRPTGEWIGMDPRACCDDRVDSIIR